MSSTPVTRAAAVTPPERRVRHQARDAAVLMTFSLAVSLGCAMLMLLLTGLGR
jgi:hypothetical protein